MVSSTHQSPGSRTGASKIPSNKPETGQETYLVPIDNLRTKPPLTNALLQMHLQRPLDRTRHVLPPYLNTPSTQRRQLPKRILKQIQPVGSALGTLVYDHRRCLGAGGAGDEDAGAAGGAVRPVVGGEGCAVEVGGEGVGAETAGAAGEVARVEGCCAGSLGEG